MTTVAHPSTLLSDMNRMLNEAEELLPPHLVRSIRFLLPVKAYEVFIDEISGQSGTEVQGITYYRGLKVHRYPGPKIQIVCILEEMEYDPTAREEDIDVDDVIRRLRESFDRLRGEATSPPPTPLPPGPSTATSEGPGCPEGSAPRFVEPFEILPPRSGRRIRNR